MAISTSSYFSNAIVGVPQVAGEYVDIYAIHSSPKYALGTKHERQDGEIFRYAHYSTAVSAGTLVGPTFSETAIGYVLVGSCATPSATYQQPTEPVGVYPGSKGSRFFLSSCTGTANKYKGGYVSFLGAEAPNATGYTYRIKSNGASGAILAANSLYELYDPLQYEVGPTSFPMIAPCRYNNLAAVIAGANLPTGVSAAGSTAGYFGWLQCKGIVNIPTDAAAGSGNAVGIPLIPTLATPGACTPAFILGASGMAGTSTSYVIGTVASAGSVGQGVLVNLMLE